MLTSTPLFVQRLNHLPDKFCRGKVRRYHAGDGRKLHYIHTDNIMIFYYMLEKLDYRIPQKPSGLRRANLRHQRMVKRVKIKSDIHIFL